MGQIDLLDELRLVAHYELFVQRAEILTNRKQVIRIIVMERGLFIVFYAPSIMKQKITVHDNTKNI